MRNAGFKTCGGSIAVGNPQLQVFNDPLGNQILTIILPALVQCDYWSYHAYWDGRYNPADNWWAHRYREIVKVAAELGYKLPPLIISECGCDHGGGKLDGWRARMGWAEHWADVQAFSKEIAKDSYVVAATLFTSAPNNDWTYFEYDQAQAETIGKQRLGEPVADIPATPAPTQAEIEKALGDEMQQHIIPLNPNAALERAMSVYGLLPASGEFDVGFGGQTYRCQGARQAGEREWQYIVYAVKDAWDSVHIFKRAN